MQFVEVTIVTTSQGADLVADKLWEYTVYGVQISDVKDVIALQKDKSYYWDYIEENLLEDNGVVLVKCFIPVSDKDKVMPKIREDLATLEENSKGYILLGSLEITTKIIEDDDWVNVWKKHYKPIEKGRVVICPEWLTYDGENKVIVKLNPNMAFGTGEHETTSMCVDLLQKYLQDGDVVYDIGCGSGILGITCAMLGAKEVLLTDIDSLSIKSSIDNAKLNNVQDKLTIKQTSLLDGVDGVADFIIANITAEILVMLSPMVPSRLKDNGFLLLSGIIHSRRELVKDTYEKLGFKFVEIKTLGEWNCMVFQKVAK